jgi:hypothetical protein
VGNTGSAANDGAVARPAVRNARNVNKIMKRLIGGIALAAL